MRASSVKRLLGIGAMALLLTGCFRVNFDIEVSPEDTVDGTAVIAVDQDLLELSGQTEEQLFDQMDLTSNLPPNASVRRYEQDGFIGQQITFEDVPLNEFQQSDVVRNRRRPAHRARGRRVRRDRGTRHERSGVHGRRRAGAAPRELRVPHLDDVPGPVTSATGEIDGNTVTWEPKFGENTTIEARASAIPSESSPWLMIVLIAGGAILLGGLAYVLTHRSKAVPATGPMDDGSTAPVDPSMAAAAPIAAPPAPTDAPSAPEAAARSDRRAADAHAAGPAGGPEPPTEPIPSGEDTAPVPPEEPEPPAAPEDQEEPPTAPSS